MSPEFAAYNSGDTKALQTYAKFNGIPLRTKGLPGSLERKRREKKHKGLDSNKARTHRTLYFKANVLN